MPRALGEAQRKKDIEILDLRHQLLVLQRQVGKSAFTDTDRAILAGLLHHLPPWVVQLGRNLLMDLEDTGSKASFLIRDRDSKFTTAFDAVLADAGIGIVRSGIRTPRMNSIMERWIQTPGCWNAAADPRHGRRLHIDDSDSSDDMPHRRSPGEMASLRSGLLLMEELADAWGVDPRGDGKSTWFESYDKLPRAP
ncbi:hypothetical protein SAMN05216499_11696 [Actinacidiphila paucisporea]|uniref:Integrase n=1 Tax=Actinacidiphila paucisporea TaxID=310782 RepID=A0A1M7MLS1_9ACTN|nr:hypothetical protein SAMN05216499_11696 [Actinacidiphila paucisporea]